MAGAFKHLIDAALVRTMATHLGRAGRGFDGAGFVALAVDGLEALEMKARAMHIADALVATLPVDFRTACQQVERALAPAWADDRLGSDAPGVHGLEGWSLWPVGEFVVRRGLDDPDRALPLLRELTQRFSAEFAIRPFIAARPVPTLRTLHGWIGDPSAHVRRLVSEGSRPRLPWGMRLDAVIADPGLTRPLLQALLDDPSEYVRRSVANHLNDVARDHPEQAARWIAEWLPGAPPPRRALLRHAARSLIKAGHPVALAAFGVARPLKGHVALRLQSRRVPIGGVLQLELRVESAAARAQPLLVDYAVHHVKADGRRTPKVFKGWAFELGPGEVRELVRRHSLRRVTTRRYHPGRHLLDLRINGRTVAEAEFDLLPERPT